MKVISEFTLPLALDDFVAVFWMDNCWFERFLCEGLEDLSVNVGEWMATNGSESLSDSEANAELLKRSIRSYHPSKLSFPGLPSHAESIKTQTLSTTKAGMAGEESKLVIKESNSFRGIPYSDYFTVNTEWHVRSRAPTARSYDEEAQASISSTSASVLDVSIYLEVVFLKSTWLQGTIESNTHAELVTVCDKWLERAKLTIDSRKHAPTTEDETLLQTRSNSHVQLSMLSRSNSLLSADRKNQQQSAGKISNGLASEGGAPLMQPREVAEDLCMPSDDIFIAIDNNISISNVLSFVAGTGDASSNSPRPTRSFEDRSVTGGASEYGSDEELLFYDCEEGGVDFMHSPQPSVMIMGSLSANRLSLSRNASFASSLPSSASLSAPAVVRNAPTPADLRALYHSSDDRPLTGDKGSQEHPIYSSRDVAVDIVETCLVLLQYSYWQVYSLYRYDLKELFKISPNEVMQRVGCSFVPGWHGSPMMQPDFYGPLIAVFTLPQSLLLSMDVNRNGCSQTAVLGNGVVVSLCLWIGLSVLYRTLAFIVAPHVGIQQCLCITGYSFFSWNFALLCSYPLEKYQDQIGLPVALPLALFGLPSALAQGFLFWELTPASSMKLRPKAFPTSLQRFAQSNSRCLQRVLWAVPKIMALVVVAGTHYQFLWYVARVFLPGRKQQCQLSALVQPGQYADILTQKELRKYALLLLGGRSVDDDP